MTLRKAVLWRKGSFGSQSAGGCLYVSRILTAVASLRKQRRDVLGFLEAAVRAHRAGDLAARCVAWALRGSVGRLRMLGAEF